MLVGVISDVHGNAVALESVLRFLRARGVEEIWCAGDIVGYGPDPEECIEQISENTCLCVRGNHEAAVLWEAGAASFNWAARAACEWTRGRIKARGWGYLAALPLTWERKEERALVVHAEPGCAVLFDYISTLGEGMRNLEKVREGWVCFVGHSHGACVFREEGGRWTEGKGKLRLGKKEKAIINVGSVGQPRDGDPRSCCVLFDTEKREISFERVWYDTEEAVERVSKAGLPSVLGERLRVGR